MACLRSRSIVLSTADGRFPLCQTCHDFDADDADLLAEEEAYLAAAWETGIERGEQWALDAPHPNDPWWEPGDV